MTRAQPLCDPSWRGLLRVRPLLARVKKARAPTWFKLAAAITGMILTLARERRGVGEGGERVRERESERERERERERESARVCVCALAAVAITPVLQNLT